MPIDPQHHEDSEAGLARVFDLAAEEVVVTSDPLVLGGLARGRARRRRRRIATVAAGCAVLALAVVGGVVANSLPQVPTSHALELADGITTPPPHLDKGLNILIVGLDSRKAMDGSDLSPSFVQDQLHAGSSSDIGGDNTDTLLMLHVPANGGPATAVSVPRDTWVKGEGVDGRMHRMSTVYPLAEELAKAKLRDSGLSAAQLQARGREAGRAATIATVQQLLGTPIDHFVELNLAAFYDIAQAVAPIQVCVNQATKDPLSGTDLPAGVSTLNAAQALAFVRQRHDLPYGDLSRIRRQQAFIVSVLHTLRQAGVFTDLGSMQRLFKVVGTDLATDSGWSPLDLARQVPGLTDGRMVFRTLPVAGYAMVHDGAGQLSVLKVDPAKVRELAQQTLSDAAAASLPAPSGSEGASGVSGASTAPGQPGQPEQQLGPVNGVPCVD